MIDNCTLRATLHTFVRQPNGSFTGFIAFGDAYRSRPALDLRRGSRHHVREALSEGYERRALCTRTYVASGAWRAAWRSWQRSPGGGTLASPPQRNGR
jgi:hypothetical protein